METKYPVSKETPQTCKAFSKKHLNNALRGWLRGQQRKEPVKTITPQALTAEEVSGKVCETK